MTTPPQQSRLQAAIDAAAASFTADLIAAIRRSTVAELAGLSDRPTPATSPASTRRPVPVIALASVPTEPPEPSVEDDAVVNEGQEPPTAPVSATEAPAAPEAAVVAAKAPAKKKRAWPTCSVEGCNAKMYGPSGPARHCYQHHVEAGGALSPFAGRKMAASDSSPGEGTAAGAQAEPKARKVIRRRKGDQGADAPAARAAKPKPVEQPPLSSKDTGLRQLEAKLAAGKA
jgi:hypothetical protein